MLQKINSNFQSAIYLRGSQVNVPDKLTLECLSILLRSLEQVTKAEISFLIVFRLGNLKT